MGSGSSSSKSADVGDLLARTHFTEHELRDLLKQFRRAVGSSSSSSSSSPTGGGSNASSGGGGGGGNGGNMVSVAGRSVGELSWKQWRELAHQIRVDDEPLQRAVFRLFDVDGDGAVSFDDYVNALETIHHGTAKAKLQLTSHALSSDGGAHVQREEVVRVLAALQGLIASQEQGLESQSGKIFLSADEYADYLLSDVSAVSGTSLTSSSPASSSASSSAAAASSLALLSDAYVEGALRQIDVFLALKVQPLQDTED